jgi:hypothetical protein
MKKINMSEENKTLCLKAIHFIKENKIDDLKKLLDENSGFLIADYKIFSGSTMLYDAVYAGNIDICNFLIEFQIDINEEARNDTALGVAAKQGYLHICKWMLDHGAFVDGSILSVTTPLINSIIFGHAEVAKFLIAKGANINAVHLTQNKTPLDYAKIWGLKEIEDILTSKGAITLSKPIDWETEYGGPLLKYVNDNAGAVLPISLLPVVSNNQNISLRIAHVNRKQQKYLFTIGLFAKHKPMIELSIVVSASWNLNNNSSKNTFPCALLMNLSELITNGITVKEGDFISCDNEKLAGLEWPSHIEGFWICDYSWKKENHKELKKDEANTNSVTFFTLVPEIKVKNKKPLVYNVDKNRYAAWSKIAIF